VNIPGFTAEASLHPCSVRYTAAATYDCANGYASVRLPLEPMVVPQLPIRVGRVCGPCTLSVGPFKIGIKRCTDFNCDLQTFECDFGDSETVLC